MQLGMIGLGRMGGNMTKRLAQAGHDMKSYARSGGGTAASLEELRDQLDAPRSFWMMVPALTSPAVTVQSPGPPSVSVPAFVKVLSGFPCGSNGLDMLPALQLTAPDVVRLPFKTSAEKLKSPSSEAAAIVRVPPATTRASLLA